MRKKQPKNKPISLRRRLLIVIVLSWILPVSILFFFIATSYRNRIIEKTETLMGKELKNFTSYHSGKIDEAIEISKKTSYELVIEKAWRSYDDGGITESEFYNEVIGNLKSKYYNDNRFVMSVFYLESNPDKLYITSRKPKSYVDTHYGDVREEALKITGQETSDAHVKVVKGKIYIIRNLYTTTNYTKFGTLVVEMNKERLMDPALKNSDYQFGIYIDNINSMITYDSGVFSEERETILEEIKSNYSKNYNRRMTKLGDSIYTGLLYQEKFDDYHFGAVLLADRSIIYSELTTLTYIVVLILLVVVPVFIYMLYFISIHITTPIARIIGVSKEVEKGNIGMKIEGEPMPNAEFSYMMESFNRMSSEVKYMFDYAYNEKLARKEAKIIALQSQINPHFLNNTLEMMNWQARMAGDTEVSKMIEALGTLLDFTMDRSNKKLIYLSEELRCADAYFYIASMRFGQRLRIEKEIDKNLLQMQVPQLILQPIIENAVVHGVESIKSGVIKLKVHREERLVILQVTNSGKKMMPEDVDRIHRILNNSSNTTEGKEKHVSMGIRNVNERIKLIYGEEYGLTIVPSFLDGDQVTVSTITIPYEKKDEAKEGIWTKNFLKKS